MEERGRDMPNQNRNLVHRDEIDNQNLIDFAECHSEYRVVYLGDILERLPVEISEQIGSLIGSKLSREQKSLKQHCCAICLEYIPKKDPKGYVHKQGDKSKILAYICKDCGRKFKR